jgi:hypothetical protein
MLRSMTCRAAEDCQDINQVKVNPSYAEAVRRGWLQGCGDLLTPLEIAHMPLAGAWISTELAARFLADYLSGDLYFQTSRPQQNLDRARVQLQIAMQLASLQE